MASNPPSTCCATAFRHEGTPIGETKKVGGGECPIYIPGLSPGSKRGLTRSVDTYIVYPKNNKTPEKAVIFLTDIFGIYNNSQLLADEFANNGYLTVIPDLFQGDAITHEAMEAGKVELPSWIKNHQPQHVDPIVEATIKYVREELGVKKVGAVGYCFGGKVSLAVSALLIVSWSW